MYSQSQIREFGHALFDVVSEMIGRDVRDDYPVSGCPFDVQPENFHHRKSEYETELKFLRRWLDDMTDWKRHLELNEYPARLDEDTNRLTGFMNVRAESDANSEFPETAVELAANNLLRTGFIPGLFRIFDEIRPMVEERIGLLEEQGENYWSVSHRPPNYHARTVALRLARLYAQKKQERPTIGLSGVTGDPSTQFGRALRRTFEILGIDADFRTAGEWAVAQVTDDDMKRRKGSDPIEVLKQLKASGYLKESIPGLDL